MAVGEKIYLKTTAHKDNKCIYLFLDVQADV